MSLAANALALVLAASPSGEAALTDDPASEVSAPSFNRDIRPILSNACFPCHGFDGGSRQAHLRLDRRDDAVAARPGGAAIVPGDAERSRLVQRIEARDADDRMPPPQSHRKLTPRERALLAAWIDAGARYEPHWAFITPERPALPPVTDEAWCRNPIDRFVLARLERDDIDPSPEAARNTLARRAALDLTGLPPAPELQAAFLADTTPGAYERYVEALLASPRYGEHMAMAWLDAARYADSDGYQHDFTRDMWPWRDWVVAAFNANMPFDQFTIEQCAGDLLPDATPEQVLATGFHRNHMLNGEGGRDPEESRVDYVMDRVETTATTWLALTVQCARCHDHKFDPVSQREYFALYDFFNQVDEDGTAGPSRGQGGGADPVITWPAHDGGTLRVMVLRDRMDARRTTHLLERGQWDRPRAAVQPDTPAVLPPLAAPSERLPDRLALARWLVDPAHPLTARVVVNRAWARHFGAGIVTTVDDFGLQGAVPTHPELLDFLATWLVDSGWDLKALHRLIVTSATYRQSSRHRPELADRDPANALLARQNRFRLPAAVLRDQALAVSGLLLDRLGGPPVFPYQAPGLWQEVSFGRLSYARSPPEGLHRRSIYTFWRRSLAPAVLFDVSNRQACRVDVVRTNTPLHALMLLNDTTYVEAARGLAERTLRASSGQESVHRDRDRIASIMLAATGRPATRAELAVLEPRLDALRGAFELDRTAAEALLAVGEAPRDSRLDPIECAAFTALANIVLNLDEVLTRE